jgi:hypothetical protein
MVLRDLLQSSCLYDNSPFRRVVCLRTLSRSPGSDNVSSEYVEMINQNARFINIEVLVIHTKYIMSIDDLFMIPCQISSIYSVTSLILQT